jgi:hypothetical protein
VEEERLAVHGPQVLVGHPFGMLLHGKQGSYMHCELLLDVQPGGILQDGEDGAMPAK